MAQQSESKISTEYGYPLAMFHPIEHIAPDADPETRIQLFENYLVEEDLVCSICFNIPKNPWTVRTNGKAHCDNKIMCEKCIHKCYETDAYGPKTKCPMCRGENIL
jgi:hypothetical protein